jgi:hypothetical protein
MKLFSLISLIVISFLFNACGNGGNSDTSSTTTTQIHKPKTELKDNSSLNTLPKLQGVTSSPTDALETK